MKPLIILPLFAVLILSGCGQTGPLYLPKPDVQAQKPAAGKVSQKKHTKKAVTEATTHKTDTFY